MPQYFVLFLSFIAVGWALIELLLARRSDSFIVAVNCFWALYNSGLALAVITFDYKKLFQRRSEFRVPDTVLISYRPLGAVEDRDDNLAVAQDITEEGMSMLSINQGEVGKDLEIDLMLPGIHLRIQGQVIRQRSVNANQYQISESGLRFIKIRQEAVDIMDRYIHESAVRKFLKDYVTESKTYMERRFGRKDKVKERSYRFLAYLPVVLMDQTGEQSYAVIKDISNTGLLLASRKSWPAGSKLDIDIVLGNERVALLGVVVRDFTHDSEDFREYLFGIQLIEADQEKVRRILSIAEKIGTFVLE